MSDLIPPILSSTPPPLADVAEDEEDDFGDFAVADDPFQTDVETTGIKDIPWSDECSKKSTDNTSQDSVLSNNTDSGLCSDSSPPPGPDGSACDQQPAANCDVPSSERCDLLKTVLENNCIPAEPVVENGNLDNGVDSKKLDTGCFEDSEFIESSQSEDLEWGTVQEATLNDVNSNLSKGIENIEPEESSDFASGSPEPNGNRVELRDLQLHSSEILVLEASPEKSPSDLSFLNEQPPALEDSPDAASDDFSFPEVVDCIEESPVLAEEPAVFAEVPPTSSKEPPALEEEPPVLADEIPDDEDFGSFGGAVEFDAFGGSMEDVEFGAFGDSVADDADWALPETQITEPSAAAADDDDFGDFEEANDNEFGQFEVSATQETAPEMTEEESEDKADDLFGQSEKIVQCVEDIFECDDELDPPKAMSALSSHLKHLWPEIQDVQNTPALEFQWSNSRSHDQLLCSLGIDSRNILYGPQWNSNMPRFAANLGNSPLEPMKAADVAPQVGAAVPEQEGVPAAQFDWNGSGLVNPLDSNMLLSIDLLWEPPSEQQSVKKGLSAAAQKILASLPDLNFMRAATMSRTPV